MQYKGSSREHEISASRRRKDTRTVSRRISDGLRKGDGVVLGLIMLMIAAVILIRVPFSGELMLLVAWAYKRKYVHLGHQIFNFPYRLPVQAGLRDGSIPDAKPGTGITYIGRDLETHLQVYANNSDLRTHMLVLGTTGSGKTEFLLGLVANALIQNTGFIYVDGKGDPKLQKEIFRLARYFAREDDLLLINFITSGRDFVEKQADKVTNNMNMMGNISSGMLIELIVALLDDSGGGGDMWKGRAISFVAALTRPLVYLRDKGYINLSPEEYLGYFELNVLEELVWEHNGKYGELFDIIVAPLRSYLVTLPGYQKAKAKKQETKTLEQHGFIVMQLTRTFNDLTFNYGHIFKTKRGDVDFFDAVVNRRLLVALLPALERAPDSMRMLGKLIVGSVKQMMAGCLGNRVEGLVREIIDSRPTNAPVPYYVILDEYGYYAVIGFAVAPAQARSLGFSVTFAAQDFSSLKKSSAEEADATWENTNIRAIGRLTSGTKSETWDRVVGAAAESDEARISSYDRNTDGLAEKFRQQDSVGIERRSRLDYDDFAQQENGEFTFLIGKKEEGGKGGGVSVIRGLGFYTASPSPREMRLNDFIPIEPPEPSELPVAREAQNAVIKAFAEGSFAASVKSCLKDDQVLTALSLALARNYEGEKPKLSRGDAARAVLGILLQDAAMQPAGEAKGGSTSAKGPELKPASAPIDLNEPTAQIVTAVTSVLLNVPTPPVAAPAAVTASPAAAPGYAGAMPLGQASEDDEIASIDGTLVTTNLLLTSQDHKSFRERALPILQQHLMELETPEDTDWEDDPLSIADRDAMLEMEVVARGQAFDSMEERWAAEDRITQTQTAIAEQTSYIHPPEPSPISIDQARNSLDEIANQCQQIMKSDFR
ncbi:TraM recognition domain-containing protein [Castellaniella sp.]|uniref:TraM recognition domain-containing protein n=1 Tax=Castellaniella sp. TaxID=1955812 RepID=UPI002B003DBC|nr:TraM recognition domain-containing protein [Castellaniella sp.]